MSSGRIERITRIFESGAAPGWKGIIRSVDGGLGEVKGEVSIPDPQESSEVDPTVLLERTFPVPQPDSWRDSVARPDLAGRTEQARIRTHERMAGLGIPPNE